VHQECLQLRSDLIVSRGDRAGASAYILKDPQSQRFFRFREAEGFIAGQLDGATPVEEIRERAEKQFGATLPESTLRTFLKNLQGLGLLESTAPGTTAAITRPRTQGSLLYLRWRAFDPDRLFDDLVGRFRWLFTPAFVAFSAALIIVAFGITAANYGAIGRRLPALYRTDVFILAWTVLFAVIVCHEFAHGLTCKHFGGHVHELGFMLIFFQPAMYCNVSDAWLFPERRKRLWVTFAGAYFEMFLWALATVVWWVSDPNTLLNLMALIVMLTSGVKTLFNLNPLIKLDGYYLLSDLLNIPNLNRRAINYVRAWVRRLSGLERDSRTYLAEPRERRILLIYGVLAWVFSFSLLAWLLWNVGNFLTARYQAAGFLATTGLVVAFFHRPILGKPAAADESSATVVKRAKNRRRPAFAIVTVAIGAALYLVHMELTISAPFTALPVRYAEVRAEVEGIIEQVLVSEDERIAEGQTIARLSDRSWRSELDKISAEIAATGARLKMLKSGPRKEEVELARREVETGRARWERARDQLDTVLRVQRERLARSRSSVEKAQVQLEAAQAEMERIRQLVSDGAGSPKELHDAVAVVVVREKELAETQGDVRVESADDLIQYRETAVVAELELQEAQSRLALLQAGSRVELVEAAQADLARLEAHRDYCLGQIQHLNIVSRIAGVITTPRLKEMVGRRVDRGDLIASVHDLSRIRAEIAVPEKEMADIAVGQAVLLKVRAFPSRDFRGTIRTIAPIASARDELIAGRAVLVSAEFDNSELLLKPEMTGHCKINCGQRRILDVLTRRLLSYIRVEFWSWW
jgi:multidrug resistance efflux pump